MNIFEENKKKYEIKSKGDMAKMGFTMLFTGGIVFVIGLPLSLIVIGIPFVILGIILMILGFLMIIISPFYKKNTKKLA